MVTFEFTHSLLCGNLKDLFKDARKSVMGTLMKNTGDIVLVLFKDNVSKMGGWGGANSSNRSHADLLFLSPVYKNVTSMKFCSALVILFHCKPYH